MERDVDTLDPQRAQVDPRHDRFGCAEHHVGQLGCDHRAAPAVGQAGAQGMQRYIHVVVVDAHMCSVQHLDVLAVDAAGRDAQLLEKFPALRRQPVEKTEAILAAAEILQHHIGEVARNVGQTPVARLDAPFSGEREQFPFVANLVAAGLAGGE